MIQGKHIFCIVCLKDSHWRQVSSEAGMLFHAEMIAGLN